MENNKFTGIYKLGKCTFIYNKERAVVYRVFKLTAEDLESNTEWMEAYGRPLHTEIIPGYTPVDSVGMSNENWRNREERDEYLREWMDEMDAEMEYLSY